MSEREVYIVGHEEPVTLVEARTHASWCSDPNCTRAREIYSSEGEN